MSDCHWDIHYISINYSSSSLACLAFEVSDIHHCLEDCLMKKDSDKLMSALFGDDTYLNSTYMVTPYPNVSDDPEQKRKDITTFMIDSFELS